MAISYPLNTPTTIGFESIELRAVNATITSQSPFSYKQQVISHTGQRWEASVSIPSVLRDLAEPWAAFLTALKGQTGTFLLGDPLSATPRGTVSSCTLTGTAGDDSVAVTMTGSLLAGDYIQLGSGTTARLHKVLIDQSGSGTLEIWPALRSTYSSATVTTTDAKGVFRLNQNMSSWQISNANSYGIAFEAVEAITG
jgi:hypothetical protein